MTAQNTQSGIVGRRGEIMAELFFQELDPVFISRPTADFGYDLLVGFRNEEAGINTIAVQVKATEHLSDARFRIQRSVYDRLIHSNIPVLLLVADVKLNRLYYAWMNSANEQKSKNVVSMPLIETNETSTKELTRQLKMAHRGTAAAG